MPEEYTQRKPGESWFTWRKRVRDFNKYGIRMGELAPSTVSAEATPKTMSPTMVQFKYLMKSPIKNGSAWFRRHIINKFKKKEPKPVDIENVPESFEPGFNESPYFADLRNNAYGSVSSVPSDANSILFNDFVNSENPHVHTAAQWRRMSPNARLKDSKSTRLSEINYFGGVENGTFKLAPLSEFNDTTTVVPNYFTNAQFITSIEGLPKQQYEKAMDEWRTRQARHNELWSGTLEQQNSIEKATSAELDPKYQKKYFGNVDTTATYEDRLRGRIREAFKDSTNYKPESISPMSSSFGITDTSGTLHFYNYEDYPGLKRIAEGNNKLAADAWQQSWNNPEYKKLQARLDSLRENEPIEPQKFVVTYADGTKDDKFRGTGTEGHKYVLGNSNGSFFMQNPTTLFEQYPQYLDSLNNYIKTNGPLLPLLVDQGSYWRRYTDITDPAEAFKKYDQYDWITTPKFFVGTRGVQSEKKGGILIKLQNGKHIPHQFPDWQDGDKCPTGECAFFSNSQLRDYFGVPAFGNAWDLSGEPLYTNTVPKPINSSKNSYFKYLHDSADQFASGFDFSQLSPDELYLVNMYYNDSPSWYKAEPTGNGTHAGYLQFKDGQWNVVHNIHGNVHVDPLNETLGGNQKSYGVLNIYRVPEYNRTDNYKQRLNDYVSKNPMGLWTEDASNVRNWLRKNSPETLQNYWNNLTDEQRKQVDRRFKP